MAPRKARESPGRFSAAAIYPSPFPRPGSYRWPSARAPRRRGPAARRALARDPRSRVERRERRPAGLLLDPSLIRQPRVELLLRPDMDECPHGGVPVAAELRAD